MATNEATQAPKENVLFSLGVNILLPVIVLTRLSGDDRLGPVLGLLVALAFPVAYALYDFVRRRNVNFVSVIGFIGILLTGGIGLLKLDVQWIAVKEAAVPLVIGLAVLGSRYTSVPIVPKLIRRILDVEKIDPILHENGQVDAFQRRLDRTTYMIGGSFALSATLNYILARIIVVSPTGTTEFNEELGTMTALSFPVIAVPSMVVFVVAIMYLLSGIKAQTGLDYQDIMRSG